MMLGMATAHGAIGGRIRRARMRLGITQTALAKRTGITQGQISNYERQRSRPTVDNLQVLARVLGVTADYLLGSDRDRRRPEDARMLAAFRRLDGRMRMTMLALVESAGRHDVSRA